MDISEKGNVVRKGEGGEEEGIREDDTDHEGRLFAVEINDEGEIRKMIDEIDANDTGERKSIFPYHFSLIVGSGTRCTIPRPVVQFYKIEKGDILELAVWGIKKKASFPIREKWIEKEEKVI